MHTPPAERYEIRPVLRDQQIPDRTGRLRVVIPCDGAADALRYAAELYAAGYHVNVRDARGWLVCTGQRAASLLPSAVAAK